MTTPREPEPTHRLSTQLDPFLRPQMWFHTVVCGEQQHINKLLLCPKVKTKCSLAIQSQEAPGVPRFQFFVVRADYIIRIRHQAFSWARVAPTKGESDHNHQTASTQSAISNHMGASDNSEFSRYTSHVFHLFQTCENLARCRFYLAEFYRSHPDL